MLRQAGPENLDEGKLQRRRGGWRRGEHRARLHQQTANAFMLLVLARLPGDGIASPVDENHPRARADGHLAAILRKRQAALRLKMRMGERACEDIKEKDEHAKGSGSLAPKRASSATPLPAAQFYPQCAHRSPEKHAVN